MSQDSPPNKTQTWALIGCGLLLAASSSFGQTFFVSLFSGDIRNTHSLSHGEFGSLYTGATLLSAVLLVWVGKTTDRHSPWTLSIFTTWLLCSMGILLAISQTPSVVFVALLGLRFSGQGLMSHLSTVTMARWFRRGRGRALAASAMGHSVGQAALPPLVATMASVFEWQSIWLALMVGVAAVVPAGVLVLKRFAGTEPPTANDSISESPPDWTRRQVMSDPRLYALLPGILAPPFMITGFFFHQVHWLDSHGWSIRDFAWGFSLFAATSSGSLLLTGVLVDRVGAIRLLAGYLIPLGVGFLVVGHFESLAATWTFMALAGISSGAASVLMGAVWAELYGVRSLGAIRAVIFALMVAATAAAPSCLGILIDHGVPLAQQFTVMGTYAVTVSVLLAFEVPWLLGRRRGGPMGTVVRE